VPQIWKGLTKNELGADCSRGAQVGGGTKLAVAMVVLRTRLFGFDVEGKTREIGESRGGKILMAQQALRNQTRNQKVLLEKTKTNRAQEENIFLQQALASKQRNCLQSTGFARH